MYDPTGIHWNILEYTGIYWNILEYTGSVGQVGEMIAPV